MPGKIPAANNPPIDMPETIPIMIRSIDGGIIEAVAPDAAKRAVANGFGYFLFSISGIVVEPIAAVSALAEPHTPEKNIVAKITTNPSPPFTLPTNIKQKLTILAAIPPLPIMVPAKINIGIARRVKLLMPVRNFWGARTNNSGERE